MAIFSVQNMEPIITSSVTYHNCVSDTGDIDVVEWNKPIQEKFDIPNEVLEWTEVPHLDNCNLLDSILRYFNYLNINDNYIRDVARVLGEESEKQEYDLSDLPLELLYIVIEQWPSLYYSPGVKDLCNFPENKHLYFQRNKIGLVSVWRHDKEQLSHTFLDYCKFGNYSLVKHLLPKDEIQLSRGYERACECDRTEIIKLLVPLFSEDRRNDYVLTSGLAAAISNCNCELFHYFKSLLDHEQVVDVLEDNISSVFQYEEENDISNFILNNCDLNNCDEIITPGDNICLLSNFAIKCAKMLVEKFGMGAVNYDIVLNDRFVEFLPWFIDRNLVDDGLSFALSNYKISAAKVLLKIPKFQSEIDDIYEYKWWSLITCGDQELYDLLLPIFQRNKKLYGRRSLSKKYINSPNSANISQEIFVHILTSRDKKESFNKLAMITASKRGHGLILEYMLKSNLTNIPNKSSLAPEHHDLWEKYYYLHLDNYRDDQWEHDDDQWEHDD